MAWPPAFGILNVHTDADACSCTRGLYGHCTVCVCVFVCVDVFCLCSLCCCLSVLLYLRAEMRHYLVMVACLSFIFLVFPHAGDPLF